MIGSIRAYPSDRFAITKLEADALLLDGAVEGHRTQARLRRMALLGPRFHWVRDPEPALEGER
jgi:hypothetical protein